MYAKIAQSKKAEDLAKLFLEKKDLVDRVASLKALCSLIGMKKQEKSLGEILKGKYTKGIPLLTVWRYWSKHIETFGKTFKYGSIKISLGAIDVGFTKIIEELYSVFAQISAGMGKM